MPARVAAVRPPWAIEGGRITIDGSGFPDRPAAPARTCASATRARASCSPRRRESPRSSRRGSRAGGRPSASTACRARLRSSGIDIARAASRPDCTRSTTRCSIATAICTSPTAARAASRCRCRSSACGRTARARRSASGIVNPTSMAIGPDGELYVSSRFEGTVYRVAADGSVEPFATDLGVAVRSGVRSRRHAVCRRSVRHDLPRRSRGAGDDASRRCRRAWPRSTSRSVPTRRCT